jgi:hypothetical protein
VPGVAGAELQTIRLQLSDRMKGSLRSEF